MAYVLRLPPLFHSIRFSSLSSSLLNSLDSSQQQSVPLLHNLADHKRKLSPFIISPRKKSLSFKVHATVSETEQPKWWEKNPGPNMIDIHSTQDFLSALSQAGDRLVIVEFYGTWCASCRALFPKLCRTAEEHPEILFLKVNFDENKPMCRSLNVKVLPYFHFYRGAHGQLESFSCSLAKFQKIKDVIALHNAGSGSTGSQPKIAGELTLESISAPTDKSAGSPQT